MSITLPEPNTHGGYRIMIAPVTWSGCRQTLAELGAQGWRYRSTHSDFMLEVIVPGPVHQAAKRVISRLLDVYASATGQPEFGLGGVTHTSEIAQTGLEPDDGFYVDRDIHPGSSQIDGDAELNSPDPAIEVGVTSSSLPRQPDYAALGVREIWRWKSGRIEVLELEGDIYHVIEKSRLIAAIDLAVLAQFVQRALDDYRQINHIANEWTEMWKEASS